ncbi:MAG: DoxX family membrane protein [Phycisphaerales bacterium]|nr:DoxX family membrane protein [Phycisphaerales bacterium]
MRHRDAIALHTCPLLLRIGLAATFLWFGIPKFETITFTGDNAATLVNLGIGRAKVVGGSAARQPDSAREQAPADQNDAAEPAANEPPDSEPPDSAQPDSEQPPANEPDEGAGQPAAESDQPAGESDQPDEGNVAEPESEQRTEPSADAPAQPGTDEEAKAIEESEPLVAEPGVQYEVDAKTAEHITIMLSRAGHPYPRIFAWIAVFTETIGAGLLLIGLFSRVWGLGLAVAMSYAFALATLPAIQNAMGPGSGGLVAFLQALRSLDPSAQSGAFFQLMLFLAAWCIFIGGPGASSLDYLLFRSRHTPD